MVFQTDLISRFAAACTPGSGGNFLGFPTWYKYLEGEDIAGKCSVIFNFPNDIGKILLAVIEILLRVVAIVALVFVIIGAVRYTTSQGQPDSTAAARKTILNSLIGLVIAVSAAAIVSFIGGRFK